MGFACEEFRVRWTCQLSARRRYHRRLRRIKRLLDREDPDRPALWHLWKLVRREAREARLHRARVDSPSGLHGDVLQAVDAERRGLTEDAEAGRELPQQRAGGRVERAEQSVLRPAAEDATSA